MDILGFIASSGLNIYNIIILFISTGGLALYIKSFFNYKSSRLSSDSEIIAALINDLRKRVDALELSNERKAKLIEELNSSNAAIKAEISVLESKYDELNRDYELLKKDYELLKEENEDLREKLKETKEDK